MPALSGSDLHTAVKAAIDAVFAPNLPQRSAALEAALLAHWNAVIAHLTARVFGNGGSTAPGLVPTSPGGTSSFLRADGSWASAGGGSDPWTYVKLASDHANSTTTPTLSDLKFTPSANKQYEVWGILLLRSAASTTGVRAGLQFPSPGASPPVSNGGGGLIEGPGSTTGSQNLQRVRPDGTNLALTSTAHPGGTDYYIGTVWATVITGSTSSGEFGVTLESEIAASEVRIGAGSFIRYREIP